jgi:hypothetical protein
MGKNAMKSLIGFLRCHSIQEPNELGKTLYCSNFGALIKTPLIFCDSLKEDKFKIKISTSDPCIPVLYGFVHIYDQGQIADIYLPDKSHYDLFYKLWHHRVNVLTSVSNEIEIAAPNLVKFSRFEISVDKYGGGTFQKVEIYSPPLKHCCHNSGLLSNIQAALDQFHQPEWRRQILQMNGSISLGILLYGPPGTGKSTLAKTIAATLHRDVVYGYKSLTMAQNIAGFNEIDDPIVIIFDDVDFWNMSNRLETTEKGQIVPNLNAATVMDWLDRLPNNSVVIFTTNYEGKFDPAVFRPGRINFKFEVGPITDGWDRIFQTFFQLEVSQWHAYFAQEEVTLLYRGVLNISQIINDHLYPHALQVEDFVQSVRKCLSLIK